MILRLGSINGTYACACAAVEAEICVDYVFAVVANSDCAYGTFSLAGAATDANVINDRICHNINTSVIYYLLYIINKCEFQYVFDSFKQNFFVLFLESRFKRLLEVVEYILDAFDTDRNADKTCVDTCLNEHFVA